MSQPTFCLNFYNNHSIALDSAKPKNAVHATEKVIPKPRPAYLLLSRLDLLRIASFQTIE